MTAAFIEILNMSLTASFVALAVILARLLLKRAPKVFSYALWALVLFRLVCPVSFESPVSAMPVRPKAVPQEIIYAQTPSINSGAAIIDAPVNAALSSPGLEATPHYSANPVQIWLGIGAYVWLFGVGAMLAYALISYVRLKLRLFGATRVSDNLFETDRIEAPFVLGFIKPKIYAPAGAPLPEHILLHEMAHIRRRDYLIKPVAFLALALHWFNPLVWLCYVLMTRDMELSADEAALKAMGEAPNRRGYCESLLNMATKRELIPLAFGESGGGVKARVKNALSFKKPAAWLVAVAAVVVIALCAVLIPNRAEPNGDVSVGVFSLENPDSGQRVERMISFKLNGDGTAMFYHAIISSFALPPCTYAYEDGELVFRADLKPSLEQALYGVEDGVVVARFSVVDKNTLVFVDSELPPNAPLYAVQGGRYVFVRSALDEATIPLTIEQATFSLDLGEFLSHKTPYAGDNSKVSALVSLLPLPDLELIQQYISVGDDYGTSYDGADPDGKTLTVYYEALEGTDVRALRRRLEAGPYAMYDGACYQNSLALFCAIQNLEEICIRVRFSPSDGTLDKTAYSDSWYTHRALFGKYCDMDKVFESSDTEELSNGLIKLGQHGRGISAGTVPMTTDDVRALAQIGPALTVGDFAGFAGENIGSGFFIMRYEVEGGTLEVHADSAEPDSTPNYARFTKAGFDPLDQALCVDLMQGGEALKAYLEEDTASRVVNMYLSALERAYFDMALSSKEQFEDPMDALKSREEFEKLKQMDYIALPALSEELETASEKTARADIAAAALAEILAVRMISSRYIPEAEEIIARANTAYWEYTGEEAPLLPAP